MKKQRMFVASLVVLAMAVLGGRLAAIHAALAYGQELGQALRVVGHEGFADTAALRAWFADPARIAERDRVRHLSFLGGGHEERMDELERGMIYLSEQASVPLTQRFAAPPALRHFSIDTHDPSDTGLAAAAADLVIAYEIHP